MPKKTQDVSRKPATSVEEQENIMIGLAVKQAEKELREGKASAQVVLHYLKLGSTKERLEREKLEQETSLVKAKTKAYQSADELKEMYKDADSLEFLKLFRQRLSEQLGNEVLYLRDAKDLVKYTKNTDYIRTLTF